MGNPLGPTLANFFLEHLEKTLFENPDDKDELPKLYLRYINDVYAVFQSKSSCSKFLNVLNSQRKNIKFTMEKATSTLNFLDVEIKMNDIEYDTCMWRKLTNTGFTIKFSFHMSNNLEVWLNQVFFAPSQILCSNYSLYK